MITIIIVSDIDGENAICLFIATREAKISIIVAATPGRSDESFSNLCWELFDEFRTRYLHLN